MKVYCWLYIIKLTKKGISWKKERIVWIGYKKNENVDDCLLSELPKDIVFHILSWIRPSKKCLKKKKRKKEEKKKKREEKKKKKQKKKRIL